MPGFSGAIERYSERVVHAQVETATQWIGTDPRVVVRIAALTWVVTVLLVEHVDHGELGQDVLAEALADLSIPAQERANLVP